jgi:hypothetical protein
VGWSDAYVRRRTAEFFDDGRLPFDQDFFGGRQASALKDKGVTYREIVKSGVNSVAQVKRKGENDNRLAQFWIRDADNITIQYPLA